MGKGRVPATCARVSIWIQLGYLEYSASVVRFRCVAVRSRRPKSKGQNPGSPYKYRDRMILAKWAGEGACPYVGIARL